MIKSTQRSYPSSQVFIITNNGKATKPRSTDTSQLASIKTIKNVIRNVMGLLLLLVGQMFIWWFPFFTYYFIIQSFMIVSENFKLIGELGCFVIHRFLWARCSFFCLQYVSQWGKGDLGEGGGGGDFTAACKWRSSKWKTVHISGDRMDGCNSLFHHWAKKPLSTR